MMKALTRASAIRLAFVLIGLMVCGVLAYPAEPTAAAGIPAPPPVGVDLLRGAWGGTTTIDGWSGQLNVYLNEVMPDPAFPEAPNRFAATGCLSISNFQPNKRAKSVTAPLSGRFVYLGDDLVEATFVSTFLYTPEFSPLIRLTGIIQLGDASVGDDQVLDGELELVHLAGTWQAEHLDRRRVKCPGVDPDDPIILYVADVYGCSHGEEYLGTILELRRTNIAAASILVTLPDGRNISLPPYTDVFSPDVDFVGLFRFIGTIDEPGIAGGVYTFTAMDIIGSPIGRAVRTDTYVGGYQVPPPQQVKLQSIAEGLEITWLQDTVLPEAFDPPNDIGFNQVTVLRIHPDPPYEAHDVLGWAGISVNRFLIPSDALVELYEAYGPEQQYEVTVSSFSIAPQGSAGFGLEFNATEDEDNSFTIEAPGVAIPDSVVIAPSATTPHDALSWTDDNSSNDGAIRVLPNPVRETNTAHFSVEGHGVRNLWVRIFDLSGRELLDSGIIVGDTFAWHLNAQDGSLVPDGIYLYVVIARGANGEIIQTKIGHFAVLL